METLNRKNIRKFSSFPLLPPSPVSSSSKCVSEMRGDDRPLRESEWWEAHNLFSLSASWFFFLLLLSQAYFFPDKQKSRAPVVWRYFHFQLVPHKQRAVKDNVVRNDEYIASGFNIFNTRSGCGVEWNRVLDNDEKEENKMVSTFQLSWDVVLHWDFFYSRS